MADVDKATLTKLKKLYETLRELQAKSYEVTEEIGRLLNGEAGIGDKLKGLEQALSAIWAVRYHGVYKWNYTIEVPGLKRLLKIATPDQIADRWSTYLKDGDAYYVKRRHCFQLFEKDFNRFAPMRESGDLQLEAPPVGCTHKPACSSDAEHTRRRMADMRVS